MIQTKQISYSIKGIELLKDVSINFPSNEISMIIGPNGAGKSTLIKLLSQELRCTKGTVWLNEVDMNAISKPSLSKIRAVLSQNIEIAFPLNVQEVVMMGRYPHFNNQPTEFDREVCQLAMEFFKITSMEKRNYLTLSGGEKQRVNFARVAAQIWPDDQKNTKFLLLDEPLTYLDVYYQYEFMEMLKRLMEMQSMTVVGVVHDLNLAYRYADKIALIHSGSLLSAGNTDHVFTKENILKAFKVEPHILPDTKGNKIFSF